MMAKGKFKLYIYGIILTLLFFGLIKVFISGSGKFFALELLGLLVLMILSLIGFAGYSKTWGERVFFFIFLFYFINLILIWYTQNALYLVLLLLTLIGFLMSMPKKNVPTDHSSVEKYKEESEPHSEVFDLPIEKKETKEIAKPKAEPKVEYSPGKYVASNMSNIFHEARCDWAKKIKKERRIWFESKEDARKKKYKQHSCVQ